MGRVLVLDDEKALLEIFEETLRDAGHDVEAVGTAREALARLNEKGIEAVVSDITMPAMSGIDFLKAVHQLDPDLPVVLVTGSPSLETAIQALEHGAVQYLLKPLRVSELESAVERALRLRRIAILRREALEYTRAVPEVDRESLQAGLTRALASVWMAYQPIVRAADARLYGVEALMRSNDSLLASPLAILHAAEQLGRVIDVGRAARSRVACVELGAVPGLSLFVNIHGQDLTDDQLLSPDGGLAKLSRQVVIEITERASLEAVPNYRARIHALRELGFRIAVDDLGAGYAGLNSFAALEPDVVKLDIELVHGAHREAVKRKLIGSICSVCRDLGILVVAEGLELEADRAVVVEAGCDLLQGFLLGRPGSLADAIGSGSGA